jgi:Putative zinc-finger
MTCDAFEARLDALLDGHCSAAEWREADAHLGGCARCRRVFEAMSGRADDMDGEGHESLSRAVLLQTSGGGGCESARERLCDLVDGALASFDCDLVQGHLAHCEACAALAAALEESGRILPTFAGLAPRVSVARDVLIATSRRPVQPTFGDRLSAALARAAQRPRFSLEVAYVLTVLMLVVLGNPVSAFRDASLRVQPRVSSLAEAVSLPLASARTAGQRTLSRVERAIAPEVEPAGGLAAARARAWTWWQAHVDEPVRSILNRVADWAGRIVEAFRRTVGAPEGEPAARAVR